MTVSWSYARWSLQMDPSVGPDVHEGTDIVPGVRGPYFGDIHFPVRSSALVRSVIIRATRPPGVVVLATHRAA